MLHVSCDIQVFMHPVSHDGGQNHHHCMAWNRMCPSHHSVRFELHNVKFGPQSKKYSQRYYISSQCGVVFISSNLVPCLLLKAILSNRTIPCATREIQIYIIPKKASKMHVAPQIYKFQRLPHTATEKLGCLCMCRLKMLKSYK